jgi:hypothetical protein
MMVFWYVSWPFGNLVAIWYIFRRFGILGQEKSGNPSANGLDRTGFLGGSVWI